MVSVANVAAERLDATVVNMRFVKPFDEALVLKLSKEHELLVTIEENAIIGGAGSLVAQLLNSQEQRPPLIQLGLPDHFVEHGERGALLASCGLDSEGIIKRVNRHFENRSRHGTAA